jgi:hypothetical protein
MLVQGRQNYESYALRGRSSIFRAAPYLRDLSALIGQPGESRRLLDLATLFLAPEPRPRVRHLG